MTTAGSTGISSVQVLYRDWWPPVFVTDKQQPFAPLVTSHSRQQPDEAPSAMISRKVNGDMHVSALGQAAELPVLEQHPQVAFAAVVGVPDELYGESGFAYLQPVPGADLDTEGIRDWSRARLSNYKVPKVIQAIETMPLLPNGKLDKTALKSAAMGNSA